MSCKLYPLVKNNKGEEIPSPLFKDLSNQYGRDLAKKVYKNIHTKSFTERFGNWKESKIENTYEDSGEPKLIDGGFILPTGEKLFIPKEEINSDLNEGIQLAEKLSHTFSNYDIKTFVEIDKSISEKGQVIVKDGKVNIKLNPEKLDKSTIVHEFAHIYVDLLGYSHPLVKKGISEAKSTNPELWKNIQEQYKEDYTAKELEKELLVTTIGNHNFQTQKDSPSWINKIIRFVSELLGISRNSSALLFNDLLSGNLKDFKNNLKDIEGIKYQKDTNEEIENEDLVKEIKEVVDKEIIAVKKRLKFFRNLKIEGEATSKASKKGIEQTNALLQELEDKNYKEQFVVLADKAYKDLAVINTWLSNDKNFQNSSSSTSQRLSYAHTFLTTYRSLDKQKFAESDENLQQLLMNLNKEIGDVDRKLPDMMNEHFAHIIKDNTKDKDFSTISEIKKHLEETQDISSIARYTGALAESRDKVSAIIDKIYKKNLQEVNKRNEEMKDSLFEKVENLKKAGVKDFDWMIDKSNATFIQKQDISFNVKISELDKALRDENGVSKKFIKYPKTIEDVQYNLELKEAKKLKAEFLSPESRNDIGVFEDGDNKRFLSEFKNKRSQYEYFNTENFKWEKKYNVSSEDYNLYLEKYYEDPRTYETLVIEENGSQRVEERTTRFVKPKYVETTDKWNDSRYDRIMENPAKKAFYEFYMNEYDRALSKLPSTVSNNMNGRLPAISKHFLAKLSESGSKWSVIGKSVKNYLTPDYITSHRELDETGNLMDSIPILFTNSLQSQETLKELQESLSEIDKELKSKKTSKERKPLKEKKKEVERLIRIESKKLTPSEVSTDLEAALIAFMNMAENYEVMSSFEHSVNIGKEIIDNRAYLKTKPNGELQLDSEGNTIPIKGKSLAGDRLKVWMEMVLYDNVEDNNSVVAQTTLKAMNYVSLKNLGLNFFSGINNAIIGDLTQRIEAWGGQFYNKKDYRFATKEFNKYASTYLLKERSYLGEDGVYGKARPEHKISAFMHEYDILQDQNQYEKTGKRKRTGWQKAFDMDFMFAFTHMGEYANQSRVGIAMMKNTPIVSSSGIETNLWEAHEFVDGRFKLKEGFTFTEDQKFEIREKIIGLNQRLHGRYTKEDQAAAQRHYLGKAMYHFKKWVIPGIESRYRKRWYDERLGVEMEGRYRTLLPFLQTTLRLQFAYKEEWADLDDMQKANMRRNAAEASYAAASIAAFILFSSLAGEVDDDDELLTKAVNFLTYQSHRQIMELTTFINPLEFYKNVKNPVASLSMMEEVGQFLTAVIKVPYNYSVGEEDKNYYERGVYKDDWKVAKEANDLIPLLTLINRIKRFSEEQSFYIN